MNSRTQEGSNHGVGKRNEHKSAVTRKEYDRPDSRASGSRTSSDQARHYFKPQSSHLWNGGNDSFCFWSAWTRILQENSWKPLLAAPSIKRALKNYALSLLLSLSRWRPGQNSVWETWQEGYGIFGAHSVFSEQNSDAISTPSTVEPARSTQKRIWG